MKNKRITFRKKRHISGGEKKKYENGDEYDGDIIDGKRDGNGKMTYKHGDVYDGKWENDKRHGKGVFRYAFGVYEGDWMDDKMHGKGVILNRMGGKYEGDWMDGKRHGKGLYKYPDGGKYEGDWMDNRMHGKGKMTYENGDEYVGDIIDGYRDGKGTMTYENGNVYEGDWMDNRMHGKGKMTYENGNVYEGDFKKGKMTGKGKMTYANKNVYEGDFMYDKMNGNGKMTYENGNVYEGDWMDNRMHGKGKMTYANKNVYEGDFKYGAMNGNGKMTYANRNVYEGDWMYDQRHGKGVFRYAYGVYGDAAYGIVYEGDWMNDKMHGKGKMTYVKYYVYEGDFKDDKMNGYGKMTYPDGRVVEGYFKDNKRNGRVLFRSPNGSMYEGDYKDDKTDNSSVASDESTRYIITKKVTRLPSDIITEQGDQGTCYAHAASHMLSRLFKVFYFEEGDGIIEKCDRYYNTISCENIFNCIISMIVNKDKSYCYDDQEILSALLFSFIYYIIKDQFGCDGGQTILSIEYCLYQFKKIDTFIIDFVKMNNDATKGDPEVMDSLHLIHDHIERFSKIINKIGNDISQNIFEPVVYCCKNRHGVPTPLKIHKNTKLYRLLHSSNKHIETWTNYELFMYMLEYVLQQKLYAILTYKTGEREGVTRRHAVTIVEYYDDTFYIKNSSGIFSRDLPNQKLIEYDSSKRMYMITKLNLSTLLTADFDFNNIAFVFPDHLIVPDHLIEESNAGGKKIKKSNRKKKIRHLKSKTKRKYKNFK